MSYRGPARTSARRTRSTIVAALVVASPALLGVLGYQSLASSSFSAASPNDVGPDVPAPPAVTSIESAERIPEGPPRHPDQDRSDHRLPAMGLGEPDGAVPDGVTVFDEEYPAITNLAPALLRALRLAATDAAHDGVELTVDSAWRSPKYQEQLLREAIARYGSEREAARWVATPETSAHVSGDAVDIGPSAATAWLTKHGAEYGLCPIYRNEPWHYELRPKAINHGCPPLYANPAEDPRMQQ